jgi:outer membrane immunogenic protein
LVTPALAAPPVPVSVSDWSGYYLGIEGGYGWGRQNQNLLFPYNAQGTKCVDHEGTAPPTDCSTDIPFNREFQFFNSQSPNPTVALGNINLHGGLGGFFVGVQRQFGNWVVGFEADLDVADIQGSVTSSNSTFHSFSGGGCSNFDTGCDPISKTNSAHMDARVTALASARAKFGWVLGPNWLIYGTGGLGIAHVEESASQSASVTFCDEGFIGGACSALGEGAHSQLITGTTSSAFAGSNTILGYAAGAGIDWKYHGTGGSVVFGVEYLHYGFPDRTITVTSTSGPKTSMPLGFKLDVDVVKARISHFWSIQ